MKRKPEDVIRSAGYFVRKRTPQPMNQIADSFDIMATTLAAARRRWLAMTPAQRAAEVQARKDQRAAERAASPTVSLELGNLLDKLGWSRQYATHLLQSYCTCDPFDGYTCDHYEEVEDD